MNGKRLSAGRLDSNRAPAATAYIAPTSVREQPNHVHVGAYVTAVAVYVAYAETSAILR